MPRVAEGHISEPQWESGQSCAPARAAPPADPALPHLQLLSNPFWIWALRLPLQAERVPGAICCVSLRACIHTN